ARLAGEPRRVVRRARARAPRARAPRARTPRARAPRARAPALAGRGALIRTRAPKLDPCLGLDQQSSGDVGAGTLRPEARSGSEPCGRRGLLLPSSTEPRNE